MANLNEVSLYGLYNRRNHWVLPSNQSIVGGLPVPRIVFDSGCTTHLQPLAPGNIASLLGLYSPAGPFRWVINFSQGTGSVNSPVLVIRHNFGNTFPAQFAPDIRGGVTFQLPYLRFHLCYEDAQFLRAGNPARLSPAHIAALQMFNDKMDAVRAIDPPLPGSSDRRTSMLLGTSIMRALPIATVDEVLMLLNNAASFQHVEQLAQLALTEGRANITHNFAEFEDVEDEEQIFDPLALTFDED